MSRPFGCPGRLAVDRVAVRLGLAVALHEPRARIPALVARGHRRDHARAVDRVAGAVGVPAVRRRGRRLLGHVLGEVVEPGDVVNRGEAAHRLQLLAELVLPQRREAVAAEVGVGGEDRAMRAARVVPLVGLDPAPRGDRAQLDVGRDLVPERGHRPVGPVDARRLRHADVGHLHAVVTLDHDQRRERRDAGAGGAGGARRRARRAAGEHQPAGGRVVLADRAAERVVVEQLAVERRVLVLGLIVRNVRGEAVERLPARRQAAADAVVVVPPGLARERVLGGRVLVLDQAVGLDRDVGELGEVDVELAVVLAVVAHAGAHPALELAGRRLGDDAHRTAFGVAPEQRALRPAQHLDPLDVEQRGVEALLAAEIDAVDIDADALVARGLVGVERHDPADADGQRRLARFERRHAQARHAAVGEVVEALDVTVLDQRVADHRDRDRRLLQVGRALERADDDHRNFVFGGGVGRGVGARRAGLGRVFGGMGEGRERQLGDGEREGRNPKFRGR